MGRMLRLLSIEDSERDLALLRRHLLHAGYDLTCERVETPAAMKAALDSQEWDIILCDYSMPHFSALKALALLKEMALDIPFIVISGTIGESIAVEAMRAGAQDYLMKDNLARLVPAIERELNEAENRRARRRAEDALVTERRQLEDQLRQSQKMEAIGRLAGGVAHDFNNMLTAIIGYSQLVKAKLGPDTAMYKDVEEIEKAGQRAASLTSQLLAFSRKQVLQPKVLDLNAVVINIERMLRRVIGEDIEIVSIAGDDLGRIEADPSHLEQILMNLAVNARDAMPNGGKLTIETANVELDEEYARTHADVTPGHYVLLAVSDTGHGMDADTQARIFEPFFTTKDHGKGTGLGLSTVFGIVKQSGGHIWVYSEPGHGATFKIYLARAGEVSAAADSHLETVGSLFGSETIMLVEDDEAVRNLARKALEMYGYNVLDAARGGEALEAFGPLATAIDLVITDVVMPHMSGADLVASLQQLHSEVKVLYVSGYTEQASIHLGVLEGAVHFLQKPFTPDSLARKVRTVLDMGKA